MEEFGSWAEEIVLKLLEVLENFMSQNKDVKSSTELKDGYWVDAVQELDDMLDSTLTDEISPISKARAERFFTWMKNLSNKRTLTDKIMIEDKARNSLDYLAIMSDEERQAYYEAMMDQMDQDEDEY